MTDRLIRPLQDRVLARRLAAITEVGGIHLPEQARDRPLEAEVLALGPDVTTLSVGAHILIGRFSGSEVPIDGEVYLLLRLDEIFATITPAEPEPAS